MSSITERECRRCKIVKPVAELKKDRRNGDGYSSFCKDCHKESTIAWQRANREHLNEYRRQARLRNGDRMRAQQKARYDPEKIRWVNVRLRYGTTREWYEAKLQDQGGGCAICGRTPDQFKKSLSIDHDHFCCAKPPTCGKCNRGLLCPHCNTILHAMERDATWIKSAMKYLGVEINEHESI